MASSMHSNLNCFLDCTTPTVPSQFLPKTCIRDLNSLWQPLDKEMIEYFTLRDLWDQYDEWSAYGAGAPIVLNSGETVIQYYVPYLSALQIYTSKSSLTLRNLREESDESDSWSEDSESSKLSRSLSSEDSESGKLSRSLSSEDSESGKLSRSLSNNSSRGWDAGSEESSFDQEGLWPMRDRLGYLYLEYFERSPPYGRIPLMDKVNELARSYQGLMSFKSVDLSPASWMAVAWYPIYHIPTGRIERDLSTCFLTYHTLSSSFQDDNDEDGNKEICSQEAAAGGRKCREARSISLPPFGLATYKMHGNLWINRETAVQERIISLMSAADSWLMQLRVQHHDFNYFCSHCM